MLEMPKDIDPAIAITRAFRDMLQEPSPIVAWWDQQLSILDRDNRAELDDRVLRQRQGAAQAISQMLDLINNSKEDLAALETARSTKRRN